MRVMTHAGGLFFAITGMCLPQMGAMLHLSAGNIENVLPEADPEADDPLVRASTGTPPGEPKRSPEWSRSNCPAFIHIPKTGGGTIETAGKHSGVYWANQHPCIENVTCENWNLLAYLYRMPTGSFCEQGHVPPSYLPSGSNYYLQRPTFCTTRNPYDRIVSEYKMLATGDRAEPSIQTQLSNGTEWFWSKFNGTCTAKALNEYVTGALRMLQGDPFVSGCHLTPQSMYIWGQDDYQWCGDIIRLEDLDNEFDTFMRSQGCPVRICPHTHVSDPACNLTAGQLDSTSRALIEHAYYDDFVRLGYPFLRD